MTDLDQDVETVRKCLADGIYRAGAHAALDRIVVHITELEAGTPSASPAPLLGDTDVPRVTDAERAEALRVREVIAEDNSPR